MNMEKEEVSYFQEGISETFEMYDIMDLPWKQKKKGKPAIRSNTEWKSNKDKFNTPAVSAARVPLDMTLKVLEGKSQM